MNEVEVCPIMTSMPFGLSDDVSQTKPRTEQEDQLDQQHLNEHIPTSIQPVMMMSTQPVFYPPAGPTNFLLGGLDEEILLNNNDCSDNNGYSKFLRLAKMRSQWYEDEDNTSEVACLRRRAGALVEETGQDAATLSEDAVGFQLLQDRLRSQNCVTNCILKMNIRDIMQETKLELKIRHEEQQRDAQRKKQETLRRRISSFPTSNNNDTYHQSHPVEETVSAKTQLQVCQDSLSHLEGLIDCDNEEQISFKLLQYRLRNQACVTNGILRMNLRETSEESKREMEEDVDEHNVNEGQVVVNIRHGAESQSSSSPKRQPVVRTASKLVNISAHSIINTKETEQVQSQYTLWAQSLYPIRSS